MAKSIEQLLTQLIKESLGLLTFQVLATQAQLEVEKEKNQALLLEIAELKKEKKP